MVCMAAAPHRRQQVRRRDARHLVHLRRRQRQQWTRCQAECCFPCSIQERPKATPAHAAACKGCPAAPQPPQAGAGAGATLHIAPLVPPPPTSSASLSSVRMAASTTFRLLLARSNLMLPHGGKERFAEGCTGTGRCSHIPLLAPSASSGGGAGRPHDGALPRLRIAGRPPPWSWHRLPATART